MRFGTSWRVLSVLMTTGLDLPTSGSLPNHGDPVVMVHWVVTPKLTSKIGTTWAMVKAGWLTS